MNYLLNTKLLGSMALLPVTELVGENRDNLVNLALLDQGIVNDNVLAPGETVEVGIAVAAALGTVDDIEVLEGEVELGGKSFNLSLELPVLEGRELVEQGQDGNWVGGDHKGLDSEDKQPQVVEEVVAKVSDNLQESGENGSAEGGDQALRLDKIDSELEHRQHSARCEAQAVKYQARSLLVKAKFLLQNKVLIVREREIGDAIGQQVRDEEDNGLRDGAAEARGSILGDGKAGNAPELGKDVVVEEGDGGELIVGGSEEVELGLCASISL